MKAHPLLLALLASGSTMAATTYAEAQQASSSTPQVETVTVTGSNVITNGDLSPTPVTVVSPQDLLAIQPTTLSGALNVLPQFGGSQTQGAGPGAGVRNGAAAFIDLRNAGDNHTLVLLDGQRLLPSEPEATHASDVDLNLIPQMLLKRVDIVTGGAGAVYGSDAISGVVNLITDTNFTGLKAHVSMGISTYGDDPTEDGAIAWGENFGRGHLELSYEYRNDAGILNYQDKFSRPFFANVYGGGGSGTAASPFISVPDQFISSSAFGGKVSATGALASLNSTTFTQNGVLSPFTAANGAYYRNSSIDSALGWNKVFGRFDYDLTDDIHAFVQYGWTDEKTANFFQSANPTFNVSDSNPFLSSVTVNSPTMTTAQFQSLLAANPTGHFTMTEFLVNQETTPIKADDTYQMGFAGVNGKLGDYNWSLNFGHQVNHTQVTQPDNVDVGKFLAAVDAVKNSSGQIVCNASLTNPAYAGCVPLNPFGPSAASAAAYNYITSPAIGVMSEYMDEAKAGITGSPISTWAGPVDLGLTGEWHKTGYGLNSNDTPADTVNCAGMTFANLTGTTVTGDCNGPSTTNPTARWTGNLLSNNPHHSISVVEGALEAEVPLLKDVPFAEAVNLNAAGRYIDYDTTGVAYTWKLGLTWQVTDAWRLRGTRSHDIRAPNLNELFAPPQVSIVSFNDSIVTHTTGNVPLVTTSDPNLKPEQANTWTGGVVFAPSDGLLQGFNASVDAWDLTMSNTIFQVRGIDQFVINQCLASSSSPYCALYVRPTPTSFPTELLAYNQNIASQHTYGVDFESNYKTEVMDLPLSLRALVSYQPHNVFVTGTGTTVDAGGAFNGLPAGVAPSPRWRGTVTGTLDLSDAWSVTALEKWRSGFNAAAITTPATTSVYDPSYISAIYYTNLNVTYRFNTWGSDWEAFANVANLFNAFPSPAPMTLLGNPSRGINPMAIGDDPIGRYFTVGLRMQM